MVTHKHIANSDELLKHDFRDLGFGELITGILGMVDFVGLTALGVVTGVVSGVTGEDVGLGLGEVITGISGVVPIVTGVVAVVFGVVWGVDLVLGVVVLLGVWGIGSVMMGLLAQVTWYECLHIFDFISNRVPGGQFNTCALNLSHIMNFEQSSGCGEKIAKPLLESMHR